MDIIFINGQLPSAIIIILCCFLNYILNMIIINIKRFKWKQDEDILASELILNESIIKWRKNNTVNSNGSDLQSQQEIEDMSYIWNNAMVLFRLEYHFKFDSFRLLFLPQIYKPFKYTDAIRYIFHLQIANAICHILSLCERRKIHHTVFLCNLKNSFPINIIDVYMVWTRFIFHKVTRLYSSVTWHRFPWACLTWLYISSPFIHAIT